MHPQTRGNSKKPPARLLRDGKLRARQYATVAPVPVDVDSIDDEKGYAADDRAYRRAERFREVDDDDLREDDARNAEAEIAALFKHEEVF